MFNSYGASSSAAATATATATGQTPSPKPIKKAGGLTVDTDNRDRPLSVAAETLSGASLSPSGLTPDGGQTPPHATRFSMDDLSKGGGGGINYARIAAVRGSASVAAAAVLPEAHSPVVVPSTHSSTSNNSGSGSSSGSGSGSGNTVSQPAKILGQPDGEINISPELQQLEQKRIAAQKLAEKGRRLVSHSSSNGDGPSAGSSGASSKQAGQTRTSPLSAAPLPGAQQVTTAITAILANAAASMSAGGAPVASAEQKQQQPRVAKEGDKNINLDKEALTRKFAREKVAELFAALQKSFPKPVEPSMSREEKEKRGVGSSSTASSSPSSAPAGAPSPAAATPAPATKADTKNIFDEKSLENLKGVFRAETLGALKELLTQLDDETVLQLIGAVKPDRLEQLRIAAFTVEQLKDAEANLAKFLADRKAANIKDDAKDDSFQQLLGMQKKQVELLEQAKKLLADMTPTERSILEREKAEGLEPHHDFKHMRNFNLKAAPFTALGMFLYLATTGGDSMLVTASTTFSNLLQNQYFLYKVWTKLSRTGLGDEAKSTLAFGALATLPYIMATAYTATPLDNIPVWAQAAGQGVGFGPLNMYARENCKSAKNSLEQFVADVRRKEPQAVELEKICATTVTEARKHFVKSFRAYLETLKAEDALDKLDVKREYSLPEQLDKLLKQSGFTAPVPQEDSPWYKAALALFGLAGGTFLMWSSLGYGGLTGYVLAGLLGKCGVPTGAALTALTQCVGHIVTSPLYVLSCDAGISTGQAIPKIFCGGLLQKFIDNPHYRRYAAPDLITMPIATLISLYSYGSSLDLMQYVEPASFFGGDVSSFVAKWFTVAFNSQYSHLPMASGARVLARKFSDPKQAARMDTYEQLQERLQQLENMTDEGFIEMCQRLYKPNEIAGNPTMKAMLGEKHVELLRAMMLSGVFRNLKQQAELAEAEKAKFAASTRAVVAGAGLHASTTSTDVHAPLLGVAERRMSSSSSNGSYSSYTVPANNMS